MSKAHLNLWQRLTGPRKPRSGFWRYSTGKGSATHNIACHDCLYMLPDGATKWAILYERGRNCNFCDAVCDSWIPDPEA